MLFQFTPHHINQDKVRIYSAVSALCMCGILLHMGLAISFSSLELPTLFSSQLVAVLIFMFAFCLNYRGSHHYAMLIMIAEVVQQGGLLLYLAGSELGFQHLFWAGMPFILFLERVRHLYLLGICLVFVSLYVLSTFLPVTGLYYQVLSPWYEAYNLIFIICSFVLLIASTFYFRLTNLQDQQQLKNLANVDELTGLYNRRRMFEDLRLQQALAQRQNNCFSLIMADIDHFKQLNDSLGHQAGDQALKEIAELLKNNVRRTDSVSRWGGEEFLILLAGSGQKEAVLIAEAIKQMVARLQLHYQQQDVHLSLSLGVAEHIHGSDLEQSIANADAALYQAKRQGRNQVCLHTSEQNLQEKNLANTQAASATLIN